MKRYHESVCCWPGQVKDNPNLGAVNLSFSCSPRPRLDARADRPVVAGSASSRTSPTPDIGQPWLVHRKSASWRSLELTVTATSGRRGGEKVGDSGTGSRVQPP
jgi:hypothetical protein